MSNPDKMSNPLDRPFSDFLTRFQKVPEIESLNEDKINDIIERLDRIEDRIKQFSGLQLINGVWR